MRIRTIKPEFFMHADLADIDSTTGLPCRLAYIGLWCAADREGRFRWRPRFLKAMIFPFADLDFGDVLSALERAGFIKKYEVDGEHYGLIPSFKTHQVINQREAQSKLPPPGATHMHARALHDEAVSNHVPSKTREFVFARDGNKCVRCGCLENLTLDHIFPLSMGGNHFHANLRVLCRPCNSARPTAGAAFEADLAVDLLKIGDMEVMCGHFPAPETHVHARGEGKGRERKGKEQTQPRAREEILPAAGEAFETPITPSGNAVSYALGHERLSKLIACMKRVSPDKDIAELGVTVDVHADKLARRQKWFADDELEAILNWCKKDEFEGWKSAAIDPAMFVTKFDKFYTKYQIQNPNKRSRASNAPQKPRLNSSELERTWARELRSGERTWSEIVEIYGEAATREVCERTGFDPLSVKRVSVADSAGRGSLGNASDIIAMAGVKKQAAQ